MVHPATSSGFWRAAIQRGCSVLGSADGRDIDLACVLAPRGFRGQNTTDVTGRTI
jgi:hypothetical protein